MSVTFLLRMTELTAAAAADQAQLEASVAEQISLWLLLSSATKSSPIYQYVLLMSAQTRYVISCHVTHA